MEIQTEGKQTILTGPKIFLILFLSSLRITFISSLIIRLSIHLTNSLFQTTEQIAVGSYLSNLSIRALAEMKRLKSIPLSHSITNHNERSKSIERTLTEL